MDEHVEIFVFHMNVHPSAEKDFNKQWILVSLFPQPALYLFNGLMNKVGIVEEMESVHVLAKWTYMH
jgi:hypothetical protein